MRHLIIIISLCFISCSSEFVMKDKVLIYTVRSNQSEISDTLRIMFYSEKFVNKVRAEFLTQNDNQNTILKREGLYLGNDSKIKIFIPAGDYLNFIEHLPYPEINLPPRLNDTIFSDHKIPSGFEGENTLIKGYQTVTDHIYYSKNLVEDSVWVVELFNKIDAVYKGKYYFSKDLGFVYFRYVFNNITVEIELVRVNKYNYD